MLVKSPEDGTVANFEQFSKGLPFVFILSNGFIEIHSCAKFVTIIQQAFFRFLVKYHTTEIDINLYHGRNVSKINLNEIL